MTAFSFKILHQDGEARTGEITTPNGVVKTPAFMPVATKAAVKRLSFAEIESVGSDILMANTYHLALRPGSSVIRDMGGLHGFTGRKAPWITDSGGFQVFSLESLGEISDKGVVFRSHLDGSKMFLGPQESMQIQVDLGADIIMAFDQCASHTLPDEAMLKVVERTNLWAKICLDFPRDKQALYGIIQGGVNLALREKSMRDITSLPFDGYAMGGLAVGEGHATMLRVLENIGLPSSKPRYLMGVGGRMTSWRPCPRDTISLTACYPAATEGMEWHLQAKARSTSKERNTKGMVLPLRMVVIARPAPGIPRAFFTIYCTRGRSWVAPSCLFIIFVITSA